MEVATSSPAREVSPATRHDFELIHRALHHADERAYAALLHRHQRLVRHQIRKLVPSPADADDLTQETFAKAFRDLPAFRADYAFSTWLYRIATNTALNHLRRQKALLPTLSLTSLGRTATGEARELSIRDHALNPQEALVRDQRIGLLRQAVDQLPPRHAHIVRLRYFDELSYLEIAGELRIAVTTVKAQLYHCRQRLLLLVQGSRHAL